MKIHPMKIRLLLKWVVFFLLLLSLAWSCSGKKGTDLKTIQGNPETLYKQGLALFNKRIYDDAQKKFEELKSSFPDSPPFTIWAELKLADCHFLRKNYVEAIAAYEGFKKIHPTHEEMPYVQYQIGMAHFNQMLTLDRDQTSSRQALSSFEYLVANYPASLFTEKAREKIATCKKRLADHEFYIGDFYYRKEKYQAAASRFEGLLEKFPKIQGEDKTLFFLGRSYLELDQREKAREKLNRIVTEYAKSPYYKEAKAILDGEGKAIKDTLRKTKEKEAKKAAAPVAAEPGRIPLVKFEEEGRKNVSLSPSVSGEAPPSIPPIGTLQMPVTSSVGVPGHQGRTQPIPSSSPPVKSEMERKPDESKKVAALPDSPGKSPRSGRPAGEVLPGLEQGKPGEPAQPIEITSDRVETYTNENLIVFKGNVVARQKDMVIYADTVDAVIVGDGKGIERVIAGGNVRIQQGLRTANCKKAVFHNIEKRVVLTGDPKVWEGEQTISGDEIIFDIDQNRMEVKGGSGGRGKARVHPKGESEKKE